MATNYTVTDQRPVTDLQPGGTFVPAMEITAVTQPHNQPFKVRVPMSQYTVSHVDEVLAAQAEIIERVRTL